jgi:hypothetical protein
MAMSGCWPSAGVSVGGIAPFCGAVSVGCELIFGLTLPESLKRPRLGSSQAASG